jgi:acyl dehydratase
MTWTFQHPVFIGDTIYAEITAREKRASAKPGRGVVKLDIRVVNQGGTQVCHGVHDVMILSRPAATQQQD